jgi:endopolyphosphatase
MNVTSDGKLDASGWKEGKHGKHQGKQPRPEPHPKEFVFEVEYDTRKDKGFKDLTVRRWVEYARKIGRAETSSVVSEEKDAEYEEEVEGQGSDEDEEEAEEGSSDEETDEDEVDASTQGKHGKKHKKNHHKTSKEWYTFVRRAFVGTMNPKDIKQLFGARETVEKTEQEVMEL